jgi:hypothetical protein
MYPLDAGVVALVDDEIAETRVSAKGVSVPLTPRVLEKDASFRPFGLDG